MPQSLPANSAHHHRTVWPHGMSCHMQAAGTQYNTDSTQTGHRQTGSHTT